MALTFLERRMLKSIREEQFAFDDVPPMSRSGVMGSLSRKKLIHYKIRHKKIGSIRLRIVSDIPSITPAGLKALREKAPTGQRTAYKAKHGIRKLVGLNPIIR